MTDLTKPHPHTKCRAKEPTACKWHGHAKVTISERTLANAIRVGDWDTYAQLRDYGYTQATLTNEAGEDGYICKKRITSSTAELAKECLRQAQAQGRSKKHYYFCDQHRGYHLTSMTTLPKFKREQYFADKAQAIKDAEYDAAYARLCAAYGIEP